MLVILRENVANLGHVGEVVKVSDGYARNFLLPRNLCGIADERNIAQIENEKRMLEKKRATYKATALELAKRLGSMTLTVTRKVGEHDKLFGSVGSVDLAEALAKQGVQIEKRAFALESPIKALGSYEVALKLDQGVEGTIKVVVAKDQT